MQISDIKFTLHTLNSVSEFEVPWPGLEFIFSRVFSLLSLARNWSRESVLSVRLFLIWSEQIASFFVCTSFSFAILGLLLGVHPCLAFCNALSWRFAFCLVGLERCFNNLQDGFLVAFMAQAFFCSFHKSQQSFLSWHVFSKSYQNWSSLRLIVWMTTRPACGLFYWRIQIFSTLFPQLWRRISDTCVLAKRFLKAISRDPWSLEGFILHHANLHCRVTLQIVGRCDGASLLCLVWFELCRCVK